MRREADTIGNEWQDGNTFAFSNGGIVFLRGRVDEVLPNRNDAVAASSLTEPDK